VKTARPDLHDTRGPPVLSDGLGLALLESSAAPTYYLDADGNVRYRNAAYRQRFGADFDEARSGWLTAIDAADRPRIAEEWSAFRAAPGAMQLRYRGASAAGSASMFSESIVPVRGPGGFLGVVTDLTELRDVQRSLAAVEHQRSTEHELLKAVVESMPAWVYWKNLERRFLGCNPQYASAIAMLAGRPAADANASRVVGRTIFDLGLPPEIALEADALDVQVLRTNAAVVDRPVTYQSAGGGHLHLLSSRIPLHDRHGELKGLVGIVTDVTPMVEAHHEVAKIQRRWDLAFQGSGDGVWDWDRDGDTLYLSPRFKQMLGYDDLTLDSTFEAWADLQHPTDREAAGRALRAHLRGETAELSHELRLRHADGTFRTILVRGRIANRDARGRPTRIVGTTSDLTDFKRQQADAANTRKLDAIGQLAAGIAHELNTPAQFVGDNLRFLGESLRDVFAHLRDLRSGAAAPLDDDDVGYFLDECPRAISQSIEGIERISKIVRALKELAHPGLEREPTDLNRAVQSTATVASNEWKYVAELRLELDANLPLVPVTPSEFQQVVLNLIVNAAHALERGAGGVAGARGTIVVRTSSDAQWAQVEVADDGCGIPEEIRGRIFDPFFTTKPLGKGTGQGLSIVHNVVAKHGGTIAVESTVGVGTRFTVRFPLEVPAGAPGA
jgi:PAS domain S-box-containing protein